MRQGSRRGRFQGAGSASAAPRSARSCSSRRAPLMGPPPEELSRGRARRRDPEGLLAHPGRRGRRAVIEMPAAERHEDLLGRDGARIVVIESEVEGRDLRCFRSWRATVLAHDVSRELADPDAFTQLALEGLVLELAATVARGREAVHHEPRLDLVRGARPTPAPRMGSRAARSLGRRARRDRGASGLLRPESLHTGVQAAVRRHTRPVPTRAPLIQRLLGVSKTGASHRPSVGSPTEGDRDALPSSHHGPRPLVLDPGGELAGRQRRHQPFGERRESSHGPRRVRSGHPRALDVRIHRHDQERWARRRMVPVSRRRGRDTVHR
jgi:hypothetical protein